MTAVVYVLLGGGLGAVIVLVVFLLTRSRSVEPELIRKIELLERGQERGERILLEEFARGREESASGAKAQRDELGATLKNVSDSTLKSLTEISGMLRVQLDQVTGQARRLTDNIDTRLKELREENTQQIEKMRATVDEKLHSTLEKRLGGIVQAGE